MLPTFLDSHFLISFTVTSSSLWFPLVSSFHSQLWQSLFSIILNCSIGHNFQCAESQPSDTQGTRWRTPVGLGRDMRINSFGCFPDGSQASQGGDSSPKEDREDSEFHATVQHRRFQLKKLIIKQGWGCNSLGECLPSRHKAIGSTSNTIREKNNKIK